MVFALTTCAALAATTVINVTPGPRALENAQQQVRTLLQEAKKTHSTNAVEVVLADGVYRLTDALQFGVKDSGTKGNPVIWRAAHRGRAILSGSVAGEEFAIDWRKAPASLIPAAARPHVRAYRIPGTGTLPGWREGSTAPKQNDVPIQVHCGGERCRIATFPKKGYLFTGNTVYPVRDSYNKWGENWYANFDGEFYVKNVPQLDVWAKEPDLWTFGMWRFEWAPTTGPVVKLDPERRIMGVSTNQVGYGFLPNQPYNVFNAFSEITAEGDWALDRAAAVRGDFDDGGKSWNWDRVEKPSSAGECGTPHGVVEDPDAASGRFVAMVNDRNSVLSVPFEVKSNDVIRVTVKVRQYVPEHIRPYWNKDDK